MPSSRFARLSSADDLQYSSTSSTGTTGTTSSRQYEVGPENESLTACLNSSRCERALPRRGVPAGSRAAGVKVKPSA